MGSSILSLRLFGGKYCNNTSLEVTAIPAPKSLVKTSKSPVFYQGSGIKLQKINMVLRNIKKGFFPVFPVSRFYLLEGNSLDNYGNILRKILVRKLPLLFYEDAKLVKNRIYLAHLSDKLHIPSNQLLDHLSGSLQHIKMASKLELYDPVYRGFKLS